MISLQGKDASKLAGNWFQILMVLFTKEYGPDDRETVVFVTIVGKRFSLLPVFQTGRETRQPLPNGYHRPLPGGTGLGLKLTIHPYLEPRFMACIKENLILL
jgi:hypothetical protein